METFWLKSETIILPAIFMCIVYVLNMRARNFRRGGWIAIYGLSIICASVTEVPLMYVRLNELENFLPLVMTVNYISYATAGISLYFECFESIPAEFTRKTWIKFLGVVPYAAVLVQHTVYLATGRLPSFFYISFFDSEVEYAGFYIMFMLYSVFGVGFMIRSLIRADSFTKKKNYSQMVFVWLFPFILSVIVDLLGLDYGISVFGYAVSFYIFYEKKQNEKILSDSLTSIKNRSAFDAAIEQAVYRTGVDDERRLYLIMGDVDNFKAINDNYGHNVGDRVLKYVAYKINEAADAAGGEAFRLGGDEFCILVRAKNADAPNALIDSINKQLRDESWLGIKEIHVSMGVAAYEPPMTVIDFAKHADELMYESKKNFKNIAAK